MIGARESALADRTLAPFFFVKSDNPSLDQLPLKAVKAQVHIAGVIADVKIEQVYTNTGEQTLEAIYVFPASTRAAVYGMEMRLGERIITAQIQRREEARQAYEEARQAYEEAKEAGRSASLLEQQRPNVFQMNVANILPGDTLEVELRYTELLVPTEGEYEFVYPTVVGPRYTEKIADDELPQDIFTQMPYLHEGEESPYTFDIQVDLASGLPLQTIESPSHSIAIDEQTPARAIVRLDESERNGGNRD